MVEMNRLSKISPECLKPYQSVRIWATLTTGGSGDKPRYYRGPSGNRLSFFEDRVDAIQNGYSCSSPLEEPFVRYAGIGYKTAYTMRQFYADVFHAIFWFEEGDYFQTDLYLSRAYQVSFGSGVIIPFVEYGIQIIPLLEYGKGGKTRCSDGWIEKIVPLTEQYEKGLIAYRALDSTGD